MPASIVERLLSATAIARNRPSRTIRVPDGGDALYVLINPAFVIPGHHCATLLAMNPSYTVQQKCLVAQWQETGLALDRLRYAALAAQSPAESRQAAYDMLQLGGILRSDQERELGSGLVEMQRLFGVLRANERA